MIVIFRGGMIIAQQWAIAKQVDYQALKKEKEELILKLRKVENENKALRAITENSVNTNTQPMKENSTSTHLIAKLEDNQAKLERQVTELSKKTENLTIENTQIKNLLRKAMEFFEKVRIWWGKPDYTVEKTIEIAQEEEYRGIEM